MVKITKEQVIDCIKHYSELIYRVDLIRTYCLENNKDDFETELFLQYCRDKDAELNLLYLKGEFKVPTSIINELTSYIIELKRSEFNIVFVYSDIKKSKLLNIY